MRAASTAVINLLDSREPFVYADCFTFTLRGGTKLRYTNAQYPIVMTPTGEINPVTFSSKEVLVTGMSFKSTTGIEVDEQDCEILAQPGVTLGGVPFMSALRQGALDGATIFRERVYMPDWGQPITGQIVMFVGRVSIIDPGGDTKSFMKVKSETITLDEQMPRNYFQMQCKNTLYDVGCGLNKAAFATPGAVEAASTRITINWASATTDVYDLGTITMESGNNVGQKRTIRKSNGSSLVLVTPFEYDVSTGDVFKAYPGCDLRRETCLTRFSNGDNFRGFPYVPTPESAY